MGENAYTYDVYRSKYHDPYVNDDVLPESFVGTKREAFFLNWFVAIPSSSLLDDNVPT